MNFADINLLKAHDGAHFYELGVTRSVTNGTPTLEREERWVSGATYRTHAPRGYAALDALRPILHISAERHERHSHAGA
ncbi:hypothetical protein IBA8401_47400 [Pseudomonas syringae]